MLTIKVLGPGCDNCHRVAAAAQQAAAELGLEIHVESVTDRAQFKAFGLLSTPGLVINDRLVCGGRIPSPAEVSTWLADALAAA